jgi:hypothetical protein
MNARIVHVFERIHLSTQIKIPAFQILSTQNPHYVEHITSPDVPFNHGILRSNFRFNACNIIRCDDNKVREQRIFTILSNSGVDFQHLISPKKKLKNERE